MNTLENAIPSTVTITRESMKAFFVKEIVVNKITVVENECTIPKRYINVIKDNPKRSTVEIDKWILKQRIAEEKERLNANVQSDINDIVSYAQ